MGYLTNGLTFAALRGANTARLPTFKNSRGEPAHSEPDGSDWCLAQWCNAVTGELGEAANLIKKIERGDFTLDEARADLAKEFADVVTYLDILAMRAGVDLGRATIDKFNEVSLRVGSPVRLAADDWHLEDEAERCPICDEAFKPENLCATDIELGTCHAACLEGSPVVNLDTGEPTTGAIHTYRFHSLAKPQTRNEPERSR
jgi:NTP pyrophosphatase (non-canonical NTP hydrolase)